MNLLGPQMYVNLTNILSPKIHKNWDIAYPHEVDYKFLHILALKSHWEIPQFWAKKMKNWKKYRKWPLSAKPAHRLVPPQANAQAVALPRPGSGLSTPRKLPGRGQATPSTPRQWPCHTQATPNMLRQWPCHAQAAPRQWPCHAQATPSTPRQWPHHAKATPSTPRQWPCHAQATPRQWPCHAQHAQAVALPGLVSLPGSGLATPRQWPCHVWHSTPFVSYFTPCLPRVIS